MVTVGRWRSPVSSSVISPSQPGQKIFELHLSNSALSRMFTCQGISTRGNFVVLDLSNSATLRMLQLPSVRCIIKSLVGEKFQ